MAEIEDYVFTAEGYGTLRFDGYNGQVISNLTDQDAIFWSNYLTNFAKGIASVSEKLNAIGPGWSNAVVPVTVVAGLFDIAGVLESAENAATPRDRVQILSAGIASTIFAFASGYYTGVAAAGIPLILAGAGVTAPVWLMTLASLAIVGVSSYYAEQLVNYLVKATVGEIAGLAYDLGVFISPLFHGINDPLILDLDGDGVELVALGDSNTYFDFDNDGFKEKTGWVSADDGILVRDINGNGFVDSIKELFGSATQDGFSVLERLDSDGNGKIDNLDAAFSQLKVWRDLDQDGEVDTGEMQTLTQAGIKSISLAREVLTGENAGNKNGFGAIFTWANGASGIAQTVYFSSQQQDTVADNTPNFLVADGVLKLPQLPGSGQINSIAWKATNDAAFRAEWESLTENAASISFIELKNEFNDLLLKWAGVNSVAEYSRGEFVDARHLAFVEKFFGTTYSEVYMEQETSSSPSKSEFGSAVEASFDQISTALLTGFLSQLTWSNAARGLDVEDIIDSPYFSFSLLNYVRDDASGLSDVSAHESAKSAVAMMLAFKPINMGEAASFLLKGLAGLEGVISTIFEGDRSEYVSIISSLIDTIDNSVLEDLANAIVNGKSLIGTIDADGLSAGVGDNVFYGGDGNDVILSSSGNDIFVYSKGDGSDYIRDTSVSNAQQDRLVFTDLNAADVTYERVGDNLIIRVTSTNQTITSESFFTNWGDQSQGIDKIVFANGSSIGRDAIADLTVTTGDGRNNYIHDTSADDVVRGGGGNDKVDITAGNDTVIFSAGDGHDLVTDLAGLHNETDTLVLAGLKSTDVELSRVGSSLIIKILETGETVTDKNFYYTPDDIGSSRGWGFDRVKFADGVTWNHQMIDKAAWYRGTNGNEAIEGDSARNDIFDGGHGSDKLIGKQGSDTYLWSKGDGSDTIVEANNEAGFSDKLVLRDVSVSDVRFVRNGADLWIEVKSTGEIIKVQGQFSSIDNIIEGAESGRYGLEKIEFKNGVTLGRLDFMSRIVNTGLDLEVRVLLTYQNAIGETVTEDIPYSDYALSISGGSGSTGGGSGGTIPIPVSIYYVDELGHVGNFADLAIIEQSGAATLNGENWIASGTDDGEYFGDGYGMLSPDPLIDDDATPEFYVLPHDSNDVLLPEAPLKNGGHDYFNGKGGNDKLVGGAGNDILIGEDGDDVIYGDFKSGTTSSSSGFDVLDGGKGNDILRGGGKDDNLNGGKGSDRLYGGDGDDYLFDGEDGSDDTFDGGKGDDTIISGSNGVVYNPLDNGADTYVYRLGDGNDTIVDGSTAATDIDKLLLNVTSSEVQFIRAGSTLVLKFYAMGETISVQDFFLTNGSAGAGIDRVEFSDGEAWNRQKIYQSSWIVGTDKRDAIFADYTNDNTFVGGLGDDRIVSANGDGSANTGVANGSDTYLYSRGDGSDIYFDGSYSISEVDTLVLSGINSTDVQLSRSGLDLLIKDLVSGKTITNEGFFWNFDTVNQGIDRLKFSDNVIWGREQLADLAWVRGTSTADIFQKTMKIDSTYFGGRGNDLYLNTNSRGAGNSGAANGNDLFIYRLGDGNDTIVEGSHSLLEKDRLKLENISSSDVSLSISGVDLVIHINSSGQTITDEGAFWSRATVGQGIDEIEFSNGVIWNREDIRYWAQEGSIFYAGTSSNDNLVGSYLNQNLGGGDGNDTIDGKAGSDEIYGGAGNDTLRLTVANIGDVDTLDGQAGTDSADFSGYQGSVFVDLVLNNGEVHTTDNSSLATAADRLIARLNSIENVQGSSYGDQIFGDNANNIFFGNAGNDILAGYFGNDSLNGGTGADSLSGGFGSDTLEGGIGADTLAGGADNDTYVYTLGDGSDVLLEADSEGSNDILSLQGIDPSAVSFVRQGDDLVLTIPSSTGTITLKNPTSGYRHFDQFGIEQIRFDSGVIWDTAYLRQWSVYASATSGNDVLTGTSASGKFGGGKGNDTLNADGGNDDYIYLRGDGSDTIIEAENKGSDDRLVLSDIASTGVTLSRSGNDLLLTIAATSGNSDGGVITIKDTMDFWYDRGIEKIVFSDGVTLTRADYINLVNQAEQNQSSTITGTNADDTINGGGGDDWLYGQGGNDTYLYKRGDGNDVIVDGENRGFDQITFTDIASTQVALVRNGIDLTIQIPANQQNGSAGSILIKDTLDDWYARGVEKVVFADGVNWTISQLRQMVLDQSRTSGADNIIGFNTNDTLNGGAGNDTLSGAAGDDVYLYYRGGGNDTIIEAENRGNDHLKLVDVASTQVSLTRSGIDLTLLVAPTTSGGSDGGSILIKDTLDDWYARGVEKVTFSDGVTWTAAQLREFVLVQ